MSWSIGHSHKHNRDVGYGVPAICEHPDCNKQIDRGLSHACGDMHDGGEHGCGLYFCEEHLAFADDDRDARLCERCCSDSDPFTPKPDVLEWSVWKLADDSWAKWRAENPEECKPLLEWLMGEIPAQRTRIAELEPAERRAEYWKAEHLAANERIADLEAQVTRAKAEALEEVAHLEILSAMHAGSIEGTNCKKIAEEARREAARLRGKEGRC